jgi:hypothetical protein
MQKLGVGSQGRHVIVSHSTLTLQPQQNIMEQTVTEAAVIMATLLPSRNHCDIIKQRLINNRRA